LIIACDLDGVLSDIIPELKFRVNRDFGIVINNEDIAKYELTDAVEKYGIKPAYIMKLYNDEWFWSKGRVVTENIDWLARWEKRGHEIHIVTSRPKSLGIVTQAWIKRHKIPVSGIVHVPMLHKWEYMKKVGAEVIFEDLFFEANRAATEGLHAYVVRHPYNKQFEERVTNKTHIRFIDSFEEADGFVNDEESFN
jgi:uncharacterized HAD superfamily protein